LHKHNTKENSRAPPSKTQTPAPKQTPKKKKTPTGALGNVKMSVN
jgi:hypothetical protein